jgi:Tol biopolymer transport system component
MTAGSRRSVTGTGHAEGHRTPLGALARVLALAASIVLLLAAPGLAAGGSTTRVSVSSRERQGNDISVQSSISADGRYVAFISYASNLVAGDTNGTWDVFVRDTAKGKTIRVSVSSAGAEANDESFLPSISADGRYVAFHSFASNLVAGDTNALPDVFVRDILKGRTTRVSVSSRERQGNGASYDPSISADGRYVAFHSEASNLVPGDTNGRGDIFVRDILEGRTILVSVSSGELEGNGVSSAPSISADGRYVAFQSEASNLVAGDTNALPDVFVRDILKGRTTRVSVSSGELEGNGASSAPSVSADGRYVAFHSEASNLVPGDTNGWGDIFVRDTAKGRTIRVSLSSAGGQANSDSFLPSISADGRYVAFGSYASTLVAGDTNGWGDIFVRDTAKGRTIRVSLSSEGGQGNLGSDWASISADGRYVAFSSEASNLVAGDTNGWGDIFVRDRGA